MLPWDEVSEFRLEATRQGRHDIFQLTITARDGLPLRGCVNLVELPGISLRPHIAGHDEWAVHLQSLVPQRCWKYLRVQGELRSLEEGSFRRAYWNKQVRMLRWFQIIAWAFLPASAAVFVPKMINAWNMPFLALGWRVVFVGCATLMIVQPTVMLYAVALHLRRRFEKRLAANELEMAALGDQSNPSA